MYAIRSYYGSNRGKSEWHLWQVPVSRTQLAEPELLELRGNVARGDFGAGLAGLPASQLGGREEAHVGADPLLV